MEIYTEEEIHDLMQEWLKANPQPAVTDPNDYHQAVEMAYWVGKSNTETERLHGTYPLPAVSEWRIEQEIINRPDGVSCMQAALDYIETVFSGPEEIERDVTLEWNQLEKMGKLLFGNNWQAEMARCFGCDRRNISTWKKQGVSGWVYKDLGRLISIRLREVDEAADFYRHL